MEDEEGDDEVPEEVDEEGDDEVPEEVDEEGDDEVPEDEGDEDPLSNDSLFFLPFFLDFAPLLDPTLNPSPEEDDNVEGFDGIPVHLGNVRSPCDQDTYAAIDAPIKRNRIK